MIRNRDAKLYGILGFIALLFLIPLFVKDQYILRNLIFIFIHIILAASLWLIITTGQVSFCHAGFMAIGAYTSALAVTQLGLSFWLALPLAGVASGVVALLFGLVVLRIKGTYFFLVSFAFGEVVRLAFTNLWQDVLGGPQGILRIPTPDSLGPIEFVPGQAGSFYYLALVLTIITVLVMFRLSRSRIVPTFRAIREADDLAESVGIPLMRNKIMAFCIGCFFAGIAGSFYAHFYMHISPPCFTVIESINILAWVVVGGLGSWVGPIIGATALTYIGEAVRPFGHYEVIVSAVIMVGIILFMPKGLLSLGPWLRDSSGKILLKITQRRPPEGWSRK